MFEPDPNESFPVREERVLAFWQSEKIFEKSLEERKGGPVFSFYDGPPFATGFAPLWAYFGRDDQGCGASLQDDEGVLCASPIWLGLPWAACRE